MPGKVEDVYNALRKRFELPELGELEEFQVRSIEETDFLLSEIRKRLVEKAQEPIDFLSDIFQPDASITNMYESRVFGDGEKKAAFEAFRRLMFWKRASLIASVRGDEKADAEFIRGFVSEWKVLKAKLSEIAEKAMISWENESEQDEKLGYLG